MQAILCEICGSNDIIKQDGVYVCQHCGTKYTVDEVKKLMGVVEIDKSKETKNYLELARRARLEGNAYSASTYYEKVLVENPEDWEAAFFTTFFRASECKLAQIPSASNMLCNAVKTSALLILAQSNKQNNNDEKRCFEINAWSDIASACIGFAFSVAESAEKHKKEYSGTNADYSAREWIVAATGVLITLQNMSASSVYVEEDTLYINICKKEQEFLAKYGWAFKSTYRDELMRELTSKIEKKDPNYQPPSVNQTGGCYVATCVYGSYDCPEVWTLRRYRDNTLASTWYGRTFIKAYYAVSPTVVRVFGNNQIIKKYWKKHLDRMVSSLKTNGVSDKPYHDKNW